MGTTRCTDHDDDPAQVAYDHEWYPVSLIGPLEPGEPPTERGWWDADSARLVTGWRPGCECGWRGPVFPRGEALDDYLFSPNGWPTPYVEGFTDALAGVHVDAALTAHYGRPFDNGRPVPIADPRHHRGDSHAPVDQVSSRSPMPAPGRPHDARCDETGDICGDCTARLANPLAIVPPKLQHLYAEEAEHAAAAAARAVARWDKARGL